MMCCGGGSGDGGASRRSLHVLSGGRMVTLTPATTLMSPPTLAAAAAFVSPQVSPSVPLAFVIPPLFQLQPLQPIQLLPQFVDARPENELQVLSDTDRALRLSGWFYEGITYQQSQELLKERRVGTFLVRNSSDPRFLYSLSVQTDRGPTSVRLHYVNGFFRLDAQAHIREAMPLFPNVVELIEHYVQLSRACKTGAHVWVDPKGKLYSAIELDRPLLKEDTAPSLKHLARLAVHAAIRRSAAPRLKYLPPPHTQLELPKSVSQYLTEYPFSV